MSTSASRAFHWCLAGIFLPVVSVLPQWAVALDHLTREDVTDEDLKWTRRMLIVAAVDLVLAILFVAHVVSILGTPRRPATPPQPSEAQPLRIGVTVDPYLAHEGARIVGVHVGSPAERVGLRPGDVVVRVDTHPIDGPPALQQFIGTGAPGTDRRLTVRRHGREFELSIVPAPRVEHRAGFLTLTTLSDCRWDAPSVRGLAYQPRVWLLAGLIVALWLFARRAGHARSALWRWVVLALVAAGGASHAADIALCAAVGGQAAGSTLLTGLAHATALLVAGVIIHARMARTGLLDVRSEPRLSAIRATALGLFYLLVLLARAHVVFAAMETFVGAPSRSMTMFDSLASVAWGWALAVLAIATINVVGPLSEEVVFRGVILPRLVPWLGAPGGIVVTAVLFTLPHYGYSVQASVTVFLAGIVFGWARLRTGGLAVPVALHMAVNALSTVGVLQR